MSNDNTSSLKSAVDYAAGTVQNAFGSATGDVSRQAEGQAKQKKGDAEYDASQATAKLPGATVSSSGAITKDDPNRASGAYDQTVGSAKEFVGGLTGSESLKAAGRQQNREGQQKEAKGQVNDYVGGISDRITGTIGGAVASITGNQAAQADYQKQHDAGKTSQRGAEADIVKKADSEAAASQESRGSH
ncbi:hypothetical protein GGS23DRAFT_599570 [Durotheca rogersii]|uniref:uncharacterized protein n=1 Tax=Durotheca rogersii TaxID=419775 RepID=UPI002220DEB1|nr:uncharacterized protein GGS23DRAFT_599570 [Durotheca rogersii]KAI5860190.1 hypothetical protein GGS23DRAFT_599570 [Durotheca rogersii]